MPPSLALQIELSLVMDSPVSIGASGSQEVLADRVAVRDAAGRLIIPASHLKGRWRHGCEQVARGLDRPVCGSPVAGAMCPKDKDVNAQVTDKVCVVCRLFGSPQYPSPLKFADLVLVDPTRAETGESRIDWARHRAWVRPGVAIDRVRQVASDERLYTVETSPPMGTGGLSFASPRAVRGKVERAELAYLLLAGLVHVVAWGGARSRGLGWARARAKARLGADEVTLDLTGDAPVLPADFAQKLEAL